MVVGVEDSQDLSLSQHRDRREVEVNQQDHRGAGCRYVVSVVHLGWVDRATSRVVAGSSHLGHSSREPVAMFRQLSCRDVALCPVVAAAQEGREVPVVSKV